MDVVRERIAEHGDLFEDVLTTKQRLTDALKALGGLAQPPRVAEHAELGDVAAEEERRRPVDDDAELPRQERQLVQVVRPRHEPAGEAAQPHPEHVGDALVAAERRDLAEHPVAVRLRLAARFFASRRAWRSACWQVGGSERRASPAFGTRAPSPSAQTCSCPRRAASRRRGRARARRAAGRARRAAGSARTPAVQTSVLVRIRLAVGEHGAVRLDRLERRADADVDAALARAAAPRSRRAASGSRGGSSAPRRRAPSAAARRAARG